MASKMEQEKRGFGSVEITDVKDMKKFYRARLEAWEKSAASTLEVWLRGSRINKDKPVVAVQNEMAISGLWASQLKNGELLGMGYATVLRDIRLCRQKNIWSEWSAYEGVAQFLEAVARAGNRYKKELADLAAGEAHREKELAAKSASPEQPEQPEQEGDSKEREALPEVSVLTAGEKAKIKTLWAIVDLFDHVSEERQSELVDVASLIHDMLVK